MSRRSGKRAERVGGRVPVTSFPGDSRGVGPVTESDLETVVVLHGQVERRRGLMAQVAESVLDRLAAGAEVEPSCHDATREVIYRPGVTEERLIVDGVVRHRRLTGGGHRLKRRR